jgi:hypothetical protein
VNWFVGALLCWPVAAWFGRSNKDLKSGVPAVKFHKVNYDFPNVEAGRNARKLFRFYAFGSAIVLGYCFAHCITDNTQKSQNQWYNRPDLKPKAAMVHDPQFDHSHDTMLKGQYNYNKERKGKASALYRYLFARDADFEMKENPYQKMHPDDIWDARKGHYSNYSDNFGEHH